MPRFPFPEMALDYKTSAAPPVDGKKKPPAVSFC